MIAFEELAAQVEKAPRKSQALFVVGAADGCFEPILDINRMSEMNLGFSRGD